jgi:hypothetical protein
MLQQSIEAERASGYAFDAGVLYNSVNNYLRVGLNLGNIGPEMKFVGEPYSLPANIKLGIALRPFEKDLLLTADITRYFNEDAVQRNVGAELNFHDVLLVRTGYNLDNQAIRIPSIGFSLRIEKVVLEYAFVSSGDFGDMHRMGFSTELENIVAVWQSIKSLIP